MNRTTAQSLQEATGYLAERGGLRGIPRSSQARPGLAEAEQQWGWVFTATVTAAEGFDADKPPAPTLGFAGTTATQICGVCTRGTQLTNAKGPLAPRSVLGSRCSSRPREPATDFSLNPSPRPRFLPRPPPHAKTPATPDLRTSSSGARCLSCSDSLAVWGGQSRPGPRGEVTARMTAGRTQPRAPEPPPLPKVTPGPPRPAPDPMRLGDGAAASSAAAGRQPARTQGSDPSRLTRLRAQPNPDPPRLSFTRMKTDGAP